MDWKLHRQVERAEASKGERRPQRAGGRDAVSEGEFRIAEKLMLRQGGGVSREVSGSEERVTLSVPVRAFRAPR